MEVWHNWIVGAFSPREWLSCHVTLFLIRFKAYQMWLSGMIFFNLSHDYTGSAYCVIVLLQWVVFCVPVCFIEMWQLLQQ